VFLGPAIIYGNDNKNGVYNLGSFVLKIFNQV